MFDNLHINFTKWDFPVTPKNYSYLMSRHYSKNIDMYWKSTDALLSCDYYIDGQGYASCPFPVSDYAKEHLFYIKAFAIMLTGKQYYTRRQNEGSYLLLFTYDGNGLLEYNGQKYSLSKGDGFLIDCREPHYYKSTGTHWDHAVLHFNGSKSRTFYQIFQKSQNCMFCQPTNGSFQKQFEELIELYEKISIYKELLISSKLNGLLTTLLTNSSFYEKSSQTLPENLNYLVKYIQNSYHQHLTLDFLSSFSGFSKPHLIRLFNKYLGCTPKEYIIRLQIENAKNLLETTTIPATKIGAIVGIENGSYFGSLFKERTGMSPGQFRNFKKYTNPKA